MSVKSELKYLKLLSEKFPTKNDVVSEIVNLQAILNLPKGTEHFISDIHGEYEHFIHILRTASGVIKSKIDIAYSQTLSDSERTSLANLIYYPEQKLRLVDKDEEWYRVTLFRLIEVARLVSAKYTRSKVRKALPEKFAYIIDELLNCDSKDINKEFYYNAIISSIISLDSGDRFIIEIANVIRRLAIDHLHIVGDIFDRGPRPDIIMECLISHHSVDIQWGNHDVLWMGAGLGNKACIAIAVANCLKYDNTELLEEAYGISLRHLEQFALEIYKEDKLTSSEKMYKAISVIRFKLEDQLMKKHTEYDMQEQTRLDKLDLKNGMWDTYKLNDIYFPTLSSAEPFALTDGEETVINNLLSGFRHSERLQRHISFLFTNGSLYLKYNGNLIFHGSIPLDETGEFKMVELGRHKFYGRRYLDYCDKQIRLAKNKDKDEDALDFIWYLWCGSNSPLFGKDKMTTFERMFIDDNKAHTENKLPYFRFQDNERVFFNILEEFDLDPKKAHIINGHIPVKYKKGESPIKANGRLIVIDGGMSKVYREQTGIAGYTLLYNSHGLMLAAHHPFTDVNSILRDNCEMVTSKYIIESVGSRTTVGDTDIGRRLKDSIEDLVDLYEAYKNGFIIEKNKGL